MIMRQALFAGVVVALATATVAAAAEPAPVLPSGWTQDAGGTYHHPDSRTLCHPALGSYTLTRLDGPSEPGILGVCVYTGGTLRIGLIRVRKFIDGVGETPLTIQNDRTLMGLIPAQGVPPGGKLVESFRGGPGPIIEGTQTAQYVITQHAGDLLVDCISQTGEDKAERDFGFANFLQGCSPSK
jgi:hypothetical protein